MKRLRFALIACLGLSTAVGVLAQKTPAPVPAPTDRTVKPVDNTRPPAAGATSPNSIATATVPTAVTKAAAQAGVQTCLGRIDQFSRFLASDSPTGVYLFAAPNEANQRIFSTSMEIKLPQGSSYASSTFAPGAQDNCGGVYETVTWWPNACGDVLMTQFANLKPDRALVKDVQLLVGERNLRVFLMAAGKGCISIKKEMVY